MLLAEQNRGQAETDRTALEAAKLLNDQDRLGKVNNIVARNRELVYVSRETERFANNLGMDMWTSLANRMCEEARASTTIVENERLNQIEVSKSSIRDFVEKENLKRTTKPAFTLPWWKTVEGDIYHVELGAVTDVESNVLVTDTYPYLREYDESQQYFQKGSELYLAGVNAKLPSPDDDLDFKFASLPAPVEKTIAPARLINADVFFSTASIFDDKKYRSVKLDEMPSAVKIVRSIQVNMATGDKDSVRETSFACCNGAAPPVERQ